MFRAIADQNQVKLEKQNIIDLDISGQFLSDPEMG